MDNRLLRQFLTQPGGLAYRLDLMATEAGLLGADLADLVGRDPASVSRYRNGHVVAPAEVIRAWCEVCDQVEATEHLVELGRRAEAARLGWRDRVAIGVDSAQEAFTALHRRCSLVRMHAGPYIPGPLQTAGYAAAMLEAYTRSVGKPEEDITAGVGHRMERAELVGTRPHQYSFIIHEAAMLSGPPNYDTLLEQVNHLFRMFPAEGVDMRVFPLRGGLPVVGMSTYAIYTIDGVSFVVEETTTDDHEWNLPDDVAKFEGHYQRMLDACLSPEHSLEAMDMARRKLAALT